MAKICQLKGCGKVRRFFTKYQKSHLLDCCIISKWVLKEWRSGHLSWTMSRINIRTKTPNFPACLHPPQRSRNKNKWLAAGKLSTVTYVISLKKMYAKHRACLSLVKIKCLISLWLLFKKKIPVFRNSAILQVGESSLQQENLEGCGQAKSSPPDL